MQLHLNSTLLEVVQYIIDNFGTFKFPKEDRFSKFDLRQPSKIYDLSFGFGQIDISSQYMIAERTIFSIPDNQVQLTYNLESYLIYVKSGAKNLTFSFNNGKGRLRIYTRLNEFCVFTIPTDDDEVFNLTLLYPFVSEVMKLHNFIISNKSNFDCILQNG